MGHREFPVHIFDDAELAAASDPNNPSSISFGLGGETFFCLPELPYGAVWFLLPGGGVAGRTHLQFVGTALIPGQEERLNEVLASRTGIVTRKTMQAIFDWLWEEYVPLEQPQQDSSPVGVSSMNGTSAES